MNDKTNGTDETDQVKVEAAATEGEQQPAATDAPAATDTPADPAPTTDGEPAVA